MAVLLTLTLPNHSVFSMCFVFLVFCFFLNLHIYTHCACMHEFLNDRDRSLNDSWEGRKLRFELLGHPTSCLLKSCFDKNGTNQ